VAKELILASLQPTFSHFLCRWGILTKNDMTVIVDKTERPECDTVEVFKQESQALLSILTDHLPGCILKNDKCWKE
jgi:hypothetical protein